MLPCPACGNDAPPGSRFCPRCAAPLDDGSIAATRTSFPRGAARPSSPSTPLDQGRFLPGTVLAGRYRIYGLLGRGGMGEVYRADDLRLGQTVALKFLPRDVENDEARRERFLDEVRIARQISHTNVCRVYDVGDVDGRHFISMEFVDGEDLAALLRRIGRLPKDKAVQIARQLCAGLAAAHEQGILHRDLKPANVMIDGRGRARITDFGLAELAGSAEATIGAGTPAYMAPEQLAGSPASIKSDLFSLGLVLYELFTGRRPFETTDPRTAEPTTPSTHLEGFDPAVERVLLRCLRKDPRERPSSALAIAAALPGGDPLAAALAAGETPSPELVAEAGAVGGLSVAGAWTLASVLAVALLVVVLLSGKTQLLRMAPLPKPAEVLADRARTLVDTLSPGDPPMDAVYGFVGNDAYFDYVATHDRSLDRWKPISDGRAPAVVFWYRDGPRYLLPYNRFWLESTYSDPPMTVPGMVVLVTDTGGRLDEFQRVPPATNDAAAEPADPDWMPFLREAGLDPGALRSVAPLWTPPSYADRRVAWEGARGGQTLRVEAASYRGRPISFRIVYPWTQPPGTVGTRGAFARVSAIILVLILAGVGLGGVLMARRNLRHGRGDRRGALRLAGFVFGTSLASVLLVGRFVPSVEIVLRVVAALGFPMIIAAAVGVFYLALEPYARRYWPRMIVSWVRLLDGRIRDPLIGRDVAIGVVAGALTRVLDQTMQLGSERLGAGAMLVDRFSGPPLDVQLVALRGIQGSLATVVGVLVVCILIALAALMFLLLCRVVLRRPWLAVSAFFVLYSATGIPPDVALAPLLVWNALMTLITLALLFRAGFLAFFVFTFYHALLVSFPMTPDPSAWYAGRTLLAITIGAGLAAYGIRAALPLKRVAAAVSPAD